MDAREQIRHLLVTGDNRLKQGHDARALEKAQESYEEALRLAVDHGLEGAIRPLVEIRLVDLEEIRRNTSRP